MISIVMLEYVIVRRRESFNHAYLIHDFIDSSPSRQMTALLATH
jgi:hypothetical protein